MPLVATPAAAPVNPVPLPAPYVDHWYSHAPYVMGAVALALLAAFIVVYYVTHRVRRA